MLNPFDEEPVFFAPFVSSAMTVEPTWMDYSGHLPMAYYNVLFERARAEALALLGLGAHLAQARAPAFIAAEAHMHLLRELSEACPTRVTLRLVDYDETRLHLFQTLHHAKEGWISATCEQLIVHLDPRTRRESAFSDETLARIATMKAAHAALPAADELGRRIAMAPRC